MTQLEALTKIANGVVNALSEQLSIEEIHVVLSIAHSIAVVNCITVYEEDDNAR